MYLGFRKYLSTPKLPPHILNFHSKPYMILFRGLGSMSLVYILKYSNYSFPLLIMADLIAFPYVFYMFYIAIQKSKHFRFLLRTKQLDVKNSPTNPIGSFFFLIFFVLENTSNYTLPIIGTSLSLMGIDNALK